MESFPLRPFHVNDYSANFAVNVAQRIIQIDGLGARSGLTITIQQMTFMKYKIFTLIALVLISFPSRYDDSAIREQLEDHEQRLSELETLCDKMNADLSTLKTIIEAIKEATYWSDYADMIYPFEYN